MNNKAAIITPRANSSRRLRNALSLILMIAISGFYFSPLRVRAAGNRVTSFGVVDKVITDVSGDIAESGRNLAIQPDGKITVAGSGVTSTNGTSQANGYFYVADIDNPLIAVYDHNLVFQHYIFGDYFNWQFGLDFLSNGNLVGASRGVGRVVIYDPSGTVVSTFTPPTLGEGLLHDVKAGPSDLLYVGGSDGIMEFTTSGALIRSFPTLGNQAIAVLPGNILWAAGPGLSGIDVFDLVTGDRIATIPFDDRTVMAMSFSPSTGTVLICSDIPYELTLSGAVVRNFPGGPCTYGVTRGPNGDVYSTAQLSYDDGLSYLTFERWNANGEYLGSTDLLGTWPGNIVWAPYDIPDLANRAPVLSNVPSSAIVNEGETYTFTATATDPDGDILRFSIPSFMESHGASIDPVTGVFSWTTPSELAVGTYPFVVRVTDDDVLRPIAVSKSFSISINEVNSPPVLSAINDLTGYTRNSIVFTATATDPDVPVNTLTFSLIDAPAGATINPSHGGFSWIPTNSQSGQFTFTVRVSDNGSPALTDEQRVTVTVSRSRRR